MITFGQFKSAIRGRIWPAGSAEPDNLIASHDKDFIDAIVDLQTWVECLRLDNTDLYPQCSTTYNCGLTVMPCPKGIIKKVSIIDKINPTTHLEDATAADDYCSEIAYQEVDYVHVRRFLDRGRYGSGCCNSVGLWFGLPYSGYRPTYPTPTDAGIAPGLPPLPMGFHYPQESTNRSWGRAGAGVWAKERGNLYVAPWIQSTETVIVLWDGIKRTWNLGDPVDDDPLLAKAVEEYVRWQHARKWDRDEVAAQDGAAAYTTARAELIHQCREETRVRLAEPSHARASSVGLATLYYNDEQSASATCPDGQTGPPVSVTIAAGTVGSNISAADANQKARAQAQAQATAQLVCTVAPPVFWNTVAFTETSDGCGVIDANAPTPTGSPVSATVGVGMVSSTVSTADANAKAQAKAKADANANQVCTYSNSYQSYTKACPDGSQPVTKSVSAGQYTAQAKGTANQASAQANANSQALAQATNLAVAAFAGTDCGSGPTGTYYNTFDQVSASFSVSFQVPANQPYTSCTTSDAGQLVCVTVTPTGPRFERATVNVIMPANLFLGSTQAEANQNAHLAAQALASCLAHQHASAQEAGVFTVTYGQVTC